MALDPLKLRLAVSHRGAHADEHVAAALIRRANPEATVEFWDEERAKRTFLGDSTVALIGIGGGMFDEHRLDGRLPGECAATLTAKELGLFDRSEYKTLLSEIRRADTRKDDQGAVSGQTRLEWGEVVKTLEWWGKDQKVDDLWVFNWIEAVVNAHLYGASCQPMARPLTVPLALSTASEPMTAEAMRKLRRPTIVVPAYATLNGLAKAWIVGRYLNEPQLVYADAETLREYLENPRTIFVDIEGGHFPPSTTADEVAKFFGLNFKRVEDREAKLLRYLLRELKRYREPDRKQLPFELDSVVTALNIWGKMSPEELGRKVFKIFNCYLASAREFQEECAQSFQENNGLLRQISGVRVAFAETNLRKMSSWLRSVHQAQVVVIRRSSGNVSVFTSDDNKQQIWEIAEEIALAEARRAGWSEVRIDHADLVSDVRRIIDNFHNGEAAGRDLPEPAQHWYFFVEAGMLLNGSLSHPQRPSLLSNEEIAEAVETAIRRTMATSVDFVEDEAVPVEDMSNDLDDL